MAQVKGQGGQVEVTLPLGELEALVAAYGQWVRLPWIAADPVAFVDCWLREGQEATERHLKWQMRLGFTPAS